MDTGRPEDRLALIELLDRDDRRALAAAITDLMSSEVIAELNDHVREDMIEALPAAAVLTAASAVATQLPPSCCHCRRRHVAATAALPR